MSRSQLLLDLETVDLELDRLMAELAEVEDRLGESEELRAARETLETARGSKQEIDRQLRSIDLDGESLRERIAPLEKKLYSGTVRNPKELEDLNRQVEGLKSELRALEDRELDLMTAAEEAELAMTSAERTLTEIEQAWRDEQNQLEDERKRLLAEIEAGQSRRAERAARVEPADLELYTRLRGDARHRVVSRIDRGNCQVCRIAISAADLRNARNPTEIVRCGSCGRILHVA